MVVVAFVDDKIRSIHLGRRGRWLLVLANSLVGNGSTELLSLVAILGVHNVLHIKKVVVENAIGNGLINGSERCERCDGLHGHVALPFLLTERLDSTRMVFKRSGSHSTV